MPGTAGSCVVELGPSHRSEREGVNLSQALSPSHMGGLNPVGAVVFGIICNGYVVVPQQVRLSF